MTENKTKQCQNCNESFTIDASDFEFYKKIEVPEPTFCPQCRMQRRMSHWNQRMLCRRKCDLCEEEIVSIYSNKKTFPVYCRKCWWGDKWDPMDYGQEYDLSKPFFQQFAELQSKVPVLGLLNTKIENSSYGHDITQAKDCYLVFMGGFLENVNYVTHGGKDKDCFDGFRIIRCELTYECFSCFDSYKLLYSKHCHGCYDSAFLYDCRNCKNCFGCVNLHHKKYHIFNKPYSKEEYEKEIVKFDLGDRNVVGELKKKFVAFALEFPKKFARIDKCVNVSGDNLIRAKNAHFCFDIEKDAENNKFCLASGWGAKDVYDCYNTGLLLNLVYESVNAIDKCNNVAFVRGCWTSNRNLRYADSCHNSSDLFGCISLRKKQHCILNKQYSKQEYEKIIGKVKKQMQEMPYVDKKGRNYGYGDFFPSELSRFDYNETVAQQYYELDKESAEEKGFLWGEKVNQEYQPTIKADDLPDNIQDADKAVLKEIVQCKNDGSGTCRGSGVFRMIEAEWDFYQKMGIPLPQLCSECRHYERFKQKMPMRLYKRQCMCDGKIYENQANHGHEGKGCENEFETTYAPDRPEIVYCKECYQKEIE